MKKIKKIIQNTIPVGAAAEMLTPQTIPAVPEFQVFGRGTYTGSVSSSKNIPGSPRVHRNKANLSDSFDR